MYRVKLNSSQISDRTHLLMSWWGWTTNSRLWIYGDSMILKFCDFPIPRLKELDKLFHFLYPVDRVLMLKYPDVHRRNLVGKWTQQKTWRFLFVTFDYCIIWSLRKGSYRRADQASCSTAIVSSHCKVWLNRSRLPFSMSQQQLLWCTLSCCTTYLLLLATPKVDNLHPMERYASLSTHQTTLLLINV